MVPCEAGLAAVGWCYLVFAYLVVESGAPYVPVCPLFLLSGFHCPLCGSTRFLGMCLHGVLPRPPSVAAAIWLVFIFVLTVTSTARVVALWVCRAAAAMRGHNQVPSNSE